MQRILFIISLAIVLFPRPLYAQSEQGKVFGLFLEEEALDIKLAFDIGTFMKGKSEEEDLDAKLTVYTGESDSIFARIKVSARGNFRRRTCDFPPVMLNMKNIETGYSDLDKLDRVKLVSHCKEGEEYQNYVLREYLAYKLYNLVTDYSFRVRLLNISYYDIKSDALYAKKTGFILEPVDFLGKRFGVGEIEDIEIRTKNVENDILLKLSVFEYLIANSDWAVPLIHNLKVFGNEESMENLIAVPYDFDYSGWVNAHYSTARTDLGLKKITDRAFFGPCRSREEYRAVLDHYLGLEDNIIDTIKEFEYLKGRERNDLIRFVNSFYKLYNKDEIIDIFIESCNK
ncbi:MAG: hypothetical protein RQ743_06175 [Bacteroidales bacterium]|nr:hypothetical protein [Bacteroidales bacterium]